MRAKAKLLDDRGETLVEVLASVLICALSVALLFGSVMASSKIDRKARDMDERYYEDLTKAERQGGIATASDVYTGTTAAVKVKDSTSKERNVTVSFYGTERLLSYAAPSGGPSP